MCGEHCIGVRAVSSVMQTVSLHRVCKVFDMNTFSLVGGVFNPDTISIYRAYKALLQE